MPLVTNNDPTERGAAQHISALKDCDDVTTYTECGWFCVSGWRGDKRLVHAHFTSWEEFKRMRRSCGTEEKTNDCPVCGAFVYPKGTLCRDCLEAERRDTEARRARARRERWPESNPWRFER